MKLNDVVHDRNDLKSKAERNDVAQACSVLISVTHRKKTVQGHTSNERKEAPTVKKKNHDSQCKCGDSKKTASNENKK